MSMTPEECARNATSALTDTGRLHEARVAEAHAWASLGQLLLNIELHQPGTCHVQLGDRSLCGLRRGHAGGHQGTAHGEPVEPWRQS